MDCNVTRVFLKEWQRMCNAVGSCENCKLWKDRMPCVNNMGMFKNEPEKAIALVQQWSDRHPIKTRLSVFLEHYPNAVMKSSALPMSCAKWLFGFDECKNTCEECWNTPIEDGENNE